MRTQFNATGDFVIENVGSVALDSRGALGNALALTMPKISVTEMVTWTAFSVPALEGKSREASFYTPPDFFMTRYYNPSRIPMR